MAGTGPLLLSASCKDVWGDGACKHDRFVRLLPVSPCLSPAHTPSPPQKKKKKKKEERKRKERKKKKKKKKTKKKKKKKKKK